MEKKQSNKLIDGSTFADIYKLGIHDKFFINKKYKGQSKTYQNWCECLIKDEIIVLEVEGIPKKK